MQVLIILLAVSAKVITGKSWQRSAMEKSKTATRAVFEGQM
jgi:hypothetical protein